MGRKIGISIGSRCETSHATKHGHQAQGLILVSPSLDLHLSILLTRPFVPQELKSNTLKDFVNVGPPLGVTHLLMFSQTTMGTNFRVARLPRGPTLTFRVTSFSLMKDVTASQKRPHSPGREFLTAPLVVLNNFGASNQNNSSSGIGRSDIDSAKQIVAAMFQNMFPAINLQMVVISQSPSHTSFLSFPCVIPL